MTALNCLDHLSLCPVLGDQLRVVKMQVNDDMLEALQSIQQLKSIEIGYSFKCTKGAVLGLAQLTDLETLHIMGHSADDFGKLGREDMLNLAQLKMLKDLRLGVVAADGFQVDFLSASQRCGPTYIAQC